MKRFTVIIAGAALLGVVGGLVAQQVATVPESQDLDAPVASPSVITPDIPTFVTFTTTLADPNVKRPKLQFFDPAKAKWKTIKKLRDDGKYGDEVGGDRIFTLRVRFLDSGGMTEIGLPTRKKVYNKGTVPSSAPIQLRVVARKAKQRGLVVSPSISVSSLPPAPVVVGDEVSGGAATVMVPPTISVIDAADPNDVILVKDGPDGYRMRIRVRANSEGWGIEQWILSCVFGPCVVLPGSGDPQTLAEHPSAADYEHITVGDLSGIQLNIEDVGGTTIIVVLDDSTKQRMIYFEVFPEHAGQAVNFQDSLPEAISILNSLH